MKLKNRIIGLICFLVATCMYGQKGEVTITGKVIDSVQILNDVYVANKASGKLTITDQYGDFFIAAQEKDTLLFSHVGYQDLYYIITKEDNETRNITVVLSEAIETLDEVTVERSNITSESLGLSMVDEKYVNMTRSEKKYAANKEFDKAGDMIMPGGGIKMSLAPIATALFGNKKLKKQIAIEKNEKAINDFQEQYADFANETLQIPNDYFMLFVYYLIDNNKHQSILNAEGGMGQFLLADEYLAYKKYVQEK
ncbi:CarboxypepD_reg-like domain-containing protein [Pustulibacterium marinum]|uniref:CarboxypepD_reg-like domain-containing protein n=1 Tax=Pustulibacterium marinum TaxID=1224947 RepID=A0A1I7HPQ3_9FLAO|nr:carboxypeptidase-like regulatory domain-containing protein [Pustulibacterium marinum]SFU62657.1 CarboxypepD_reg-like domain-containing protein [Pustulibacterium marinum]